MHRNIVVTYARLVDLPLFILPPRPPTLILVVIIIIFFSRFVIFIESGNWRRH